MEVTTEYIKTFIRETKSAVLCTVNAQNNPHSTLVYFVYENDTFYMVIPEGTEKSNNIEYNNHVSMAIFSVKKNETVEVLGLAKKDSSLVTTALNKLAKKLESDPELITTLPLFKYKDQPKTVVLVEPQKIIFRRFTKTELIEKKI
jgi:nitroimidazol reductase NimA-like FMN-containing flavoprotein (pyridoxamine 5'-phosphate oxidase superfamily)